MHDIGCMGSVCHVWRRMRRRLKCMEVCEELAGRARDDLKFMEVCEACVELAGRARDKLVREQLHGSRKGVLLWGCAAVRGG